jgi:hypothetical protein
LQGWHRIRIPRANLPPTMFARSRAHLRFVRSFVQEDPMEICEPYLPENATMEESQIRRNYNAATNSYEQYEPDELTFVLPPASPLTTWRHNNVGASTRTSSALLRSNANQ